MGNCFGKQEMPMKDIEALEKNTRFTNKELMAWYKDFVNDFPNGYVTFDQFKAEYKLHFPDGDPEEFSKLMFKAFDTNNDGTINYREFIAGLNITTANNVEDKLRLAFNIYDVDKNGHITKDELISVLCAFDKMTKEETKIKTSPKERADKIFESVDKDRDDKLTIEEFLSSMKNDPAICEEITNAIL